jgi:hypothetical protein
MAQTSLVHPLVRIPVHAVGPDYPMETLEREETRAHALIDDATGELPPAALRVLDTISRRWLAKQDSGYLPEIDAIARRLARPGAYFLCRSTTNGAVVARSAPRPTKRAPA